MKRYYIHDMTCLIAFREVPDIPMLEGWSDGRHIRIPNPEQYFTPPLTIPNASTIEKAMVDILTFHFRLFYFSPHKGAQGPVGRYWCAIASDDLTRKYMETH